MLHGEVPLANMNATRGKGASAVWQNNMMEQILYKVFAEGGGAAELSMPPMSSTPGRWNRTTACLHAYSFEDCTPDHRWIIRA